MVQARHRRHFWGPSRRRGGLGLSMIARVGGAAQAQLTLTCQTLRGRDAPRCCRRGVPASMLAVVCGSAAEARVGPAQVGVAVLALPTGPRLG